MNLAMEIIPIYRLNEADHSLFEATAYNFSSLAILKVTLKEYDENRAKISHSEN